MRYADITVEKSLNVWFGKGFAFSKPHIQTLPNNRESEKHGSKHGFENVLRERQTLKASFFSFSNLTLKTSSFRLAWFSAFAAQVFGP